MAGALALLALAALAASAAALSTTSFGARTASPGDEPPPAAAPALFPCNVSGTFIGKWAADPATAAALADAGVELQGSGGEAALQLRASVSATEPMSRYVEGSVMVASVDDTWVRFSVRGLYFPPSGRLLLYGRMARRSDSPRAGGAARVQAVTETVSGGGDDSEHSGEEEPRTETPTPHAPISATLLHDAGALGVAGEGGDAHLQEAEAEEEEESADGTSCAVVLELNATPFSHGEADCEEALVDTVLSGSMASESCGWNVTLRTEVLRLDVVYFKVVRYILVMTGLSLAHIMLVLQQLRLAQAQSHAFKMSVVSLSMQMLLDAYSFVLHLFQGLYLSSLFQVFISVALCGFLIFAVFETRLLLTVWRAHRPEAFNRGWEVMRHEFSVLYTRFYLFVFLGILLIVQLQQYLHILVFPLFAFWVPQIARNAVEDVKDSLPKAYVVGTSLTRLFLPLYVFGCPVNFFRYEVDIEQRPALCIALGVWVALQILVLFAQDTLGARFFVPRRFLPPKYDYHSLTDAERDVELGGDNPCPICYEDFHRDVAAHEVMRTPCNHFFHTACLTRWMEQRMECPTCRARLPPL
jgi:hypothetical protein